MIKSKRFFLEKMFFYFLLYKSKKIYRKVEIFSFAVTKKYPGQRKMVAYRVTVNSYSIAL